MKKKIIYYNKTELEALKYCAKAMDFGVSLSVTAALNELVNAYLIIREDKRFRQKLKQLVNEADRKATLQKNTILSVMRNRKFYDDYSDMVIDAAQKDIDDFRNGLQQTLEENSIEDSKLIAQCETVYVLLELSVLHHENTLKKTKETFGCRMPDTFPEFNCKSLCETWGKVCKMLYSDRKTDVDLNTEHNKMMFDKMSEGFLFGKYIQVCFDEARKNNPTFTENYIKETEEE